MKDSKIAKFGRSKEKRSDAKLIVLAVIINVEGFLKYSDIFGLFHVENSDHQVE